VRIEENKVVTIGSTEFRNDKIHESEDLAVSWAQQFCPGPVTLLVDNTIVANALKKGRHQ
jgi:tRNA A37 threonylcarbamoyladenosine synthetase subunit TsaC/SUA5/YrdC